MSNGRKIELGGGRSGFKARLAARRRLSEAGPVLASASQEPIREDLGCSKALDLESGFSQTAQMNAELKLAFVQRKDDWPTPPQDE